MKYARPAFITTSVSGARCKLCRGKIPPRVEFMFQPGAGSYHVACAEKVRLPKPTVIPAAGP